MRTLKTRRITIGALWVLAALGAQSGADPATAAEPLTWNWGHAAPQGNPVFGLVFQDDQTGWAVAGGGEILRTDDGGDSWQLLRRTHETSSQLLDLIRLADGTLIAAGDGLYRSGDGGYGWEELAVPAGGPFYDLAGLPGGGISAAGEGGAIVVSTDGGDSWQDVGPGSGLIRAHAWVSPTEAFAVGLWLDLHTTDGGATWNQIPQDSWEDPLYRFRTLVLTPEHWLLTVHGEGGGLFETLDAGATWETLQLSGHVGFPALAATPGGRVFVGVSNGSLLVSDDLGRTVSDAAGNGSVHAPSTSIGAFHERPDGVVFSYAYSTAFGSGPEWLRSDDGGLNWEAAPFPSQAGYLRGIDWLDASLGVIAAYDALGVTRDGGETWTLSDFGTMTPGRVALPAIDRWFVAGSFDASTGSLYRSGDEGQSWQEVASGLPTGNFLVQILEFMSAERGFVGGKVGGNFRAFHTSDGGETWNPVAGLPSGDTSLSGFSLPVSGAAVTGAVTTTFGGTAWRSYRSTDGGASWSLIPGVTAALASVARPSPGQIVAATNQGIHHSQDDGQTWSRRTTERVARIAFCDARHGLAHFSFDQRMLVSDDGGLTWSETTSPLAGVVPPLETYSQPTALAATERGWLVGGYGMRIALGSWYGPAAIDPPLAVLPPSDVHLDPPAPNPINPATDIRFHLARSGPVTVSIHDLAGRRVRTLLQDSLEAGAHTVQWQGKQDDGRAAASGVYLVRIVSAGEQASTKVTVIR